MPATTQSDVLVPVTLVTGGEELLVDRAVSGVLSAARAADPGTEVHELTGGELEAGRLSELTSPSLFGEPRVVVVRSAESLGKDVVAELTGLVGEAADDVRIVLVHAGGNRGKGVLDLAAQAKARKVDCPPVKRHGERLDFLVAETRRLGGTLADGGARALLDAVGNDLRELAMACAQLVADAGGPDAAPRIDADTVARYYTGRAEATSFTVADRAVEGRAADALEQLRWALAVGVAPVLVTSALAQGVRSLALVRAAEGKRSADLVKDLGMPPWKIDRARKQARGWTDEAITQAVQAVAEADARVKGEAADPAYALERAVVTIARCARGR
ncbi:MAG: DNA polymerase III subunit delta [Streptosporangiales bacterium]|nr:DNA polymerase III subunit delta [Streptosporangiales bacterium]